MNRDVVKLEVDLHGEEQPSRFPFPVKPKQTSDVWGGRFPAQRHKCTTKVWSFERENNQSDRRSGNQRAAAEVLHRMSSAFISRIPLARTRVVHFLYF